MRIVNWNCELWTVTRDSVTCDRGAEYLRSLAPTRGAGGTTTTTSICKTLATPIIIIIWIRFERVLKYSWEQKISKCLHVCVCMMTMRSQLEWMSVCEREIERVSVYLVEGSPIIMTVYVYLGRPLRGGRIQSSSSMTKSRICFRYRMLNNPMYEFWNPENQMNFNWDLFMRIKVWTELA